MLTVKLIEFPGWFHRKDQSKKIWQPAVPRQQIQLVVSNHGMYFSFFASSKAPPPQGTTSGCYYYIWHLRSGLHLRERGKELFFVERHDTLLVDQEDLESSEEGEEWQGGISWWHADKKTAMHTKDTVLLVSSSQDQHSFCIIFHSNCWSIHMDCNVCMMRER